MNIHPEKWVDEIMLILIINVLVLLKQRNVEERYD